jgi:predicted aspartyl protease
MAWARQILQAFAALIFTFPALAQAPGGSCSTPELAALAISYDEVSRPVVAVSLSGRSERVIVDTGGVFSMLTWKTVRDLRMDEHYLNTKAIYMLNGSSAHYFVDADDLGLGGLTVPRFPFVVMPADWTLSDADGTIAPDLFSRFDVELDFDARRMRLFPATCGSPAPGQRSHFVAVPIRSDEHALMHVRASVDGTDVDGVIDTGSGQSVLRLDVADTVLGRSVRESERVHTGSGTSNAWDVYRAPFHELRFGQVLVKDPDLYIMTDKLALVRQYGELRHYWRTISVEPPQLIIGMSVLRKLHLYISYKTNTLYAAAAGTT